MKGSMSFYGQVLFFGFRQKAYGFAEDPGIQAMQKEKGGKNI